MRIKDENGDEWLLIDDSLGEGGELETIGKKAYKTNPQLQKWWNEHKNTKFQVTPTFVLNGLNKLINHNMNQTKQMEEFAVALNRHIPVYEGMGKLFGELKDEIKNLKNEIGSLKNRK